jgi:hypothetical protein
LLFDHWVILQVVLGAALIAPCLQAHGNDSQPQGNNALFPAEPAAAAGKNLGKLETKLALQVPAHGAVLLKLSPASK